MECNGWVILLFLSQCCERKRGRPYGKVNASGSIAQMACIISIKAFKVFVGGFHTDQKNGPL